MSLSTNTTYRVLLEKIGGTNPDQFIGDAGELFYNPSVPTLKLSDGSTAGGVSIAGGGGGGSSQWTTTGNGIYTTGNVAIGTNVVGAGSTTLLVDGNARITGILTIGTSSITLDGNTNQISIGSSLIISAENNAIALGVTGDIRRSDIGLTGIATANGRLNGTFNFSGESYSGQRITTTAESGTVTIIPHSLTGPGIALTVPDMISGGEDDGAWQLNIPFNIEFTGITTNIAYLTTNSYITFTDYSTEYDVSLIPYGEPALPKIMVSAGDAWTRKIYYDTFGSAPNRTFCVRYEGKIKLYSTPQDQASPENQVVWEAIFYENNPSQIDIQIGSNPRYASFNDPDVKLNLDGVIGFTDTNIKIGDKTTGASLIKGNYFYEANNNVFLGIGAGQYTTYGQCNNFIGLNAGRSNVNGSYNNFFGERSGYSNTSGRHNNVFGSLSGTNNTSGRYNNFFGSLSGFSNTIGSSNNFFGAEAGYNNTIGSYNNFFGTQAGYKNIDGIYNNFFGRAAGYENTTGTRNISIGVYAGYGNTSGNVNINLGARSGYLNVNGNNNIFLGSYSGISTSASNKIIFGSGSTGGFFDAPDTTKDTQFAVGIRIGNDPSNYWLVGNENFNVGIGTTNPTTKLQVGGDVKVGVNTSQGVILTDANGVSWRLIVNTNGTLSTVAV